MYVFLKTNMGITMKKKIRFADLCADQIDVMKNFAVITNVVIKRRSTACGFSEGD